MSSAALRKYFATTPGRPSMKAFSQQHLANAIFRCVENRRPMVRAANTGVTCFVNEFGRVTQILRDDTGQTFNEGVLTTAFGKCDFPLCRKSPANGASREYRGHLFCE